MAPFAALLAVVLAWGLASERLTRYSITLPIVLVAVGAILSATHVVVIQLDSESVLSSPDYLARFEAATPWTRRCLGKAVVFRRWACGQTHPGEDRASLPPPEALTPLYLHLIAGQSKVDSGPLIGSLDRRLVRDCARTVNAPWQTYGRKAALSSSQCRWRHSSITVRAGSSASASGSVCLGIWLSVLRSSSSSSSHWYSVG